MATSKRLHSEKLFSIGAITAIVLGLYLSSHYSYLLFHSIIEITTVAVAFTLFILTWNTRRYLANSYLRLLGIGYAFIALIDLLHTLAYKGMGVFPTYGSNLPTQLWLAARYLQAVTLLAAPLFVERRMNNRAVIGIYAIAVSALVAMVYSGNFPACYIEGKGLTTFKISSEYVISAVLLASLDFFYRKRKYFDNKVFFLIAVSIGCTVLSEISFTAYVSVYGFANLVGHFAKLAAFYLIYQAILVTGLKDPFDLIFRDLKQAEEALRKSQDTLEEKVRERTAELRASEARYRSLIQKAQTAIVLHDSQGRILTSNTLAQELLGLSEAQLLGKTLIDPEWHFLREDGSVMPIPEYPVSRVLASRQPLRDDVTGISRPGRDDVTWALVNVEPECDETGEIAQVIVSFVDITDRKRVEEALRRLNRELHALSICTQTMMRAEDEQTLLNDICRIICDEAGYRLAWVGYAEHDAAKTVRPVAWGGFDSVYVADAKLSWADDTDRGRGPGGTAIRSGDIVYIQDFTTDPRMAPWRASALQRGYRSVIGLSLKDETANVFGVLLIYSTEINAFTPDELRLLEELAGDLAFGIVALRARTERKRAEEEIRTLNQELEQRVAQRTALLEAAIKEHEAFTYSMAHDLRAPLRHVDGFLELLQKRTATMLDAQSQHYMANIAESARRMGTLLDELLSFSRRGRYEMFKRQVDLSALVPEVIQELAPEAAGRKINWHIADLPVVIGDRTLLHTALVNLISNALKFTRPRQEAEIEIGWLREQETETVIFVRDNGAGFDMQYADKLFGVFQRLHRADEFEGTGIGLANVRRIITRHGGRTWAEGKVDQGATFYFALPRTLPGGEDE